MAPKGFKRPASTGIESAKKRVKKVVDALVADGTENFPCTMLASTLEFSLGVFKDVRGPMQSEVVAMAGEALASTENEKAAAVAAAEEKCKDVHGEKAARMKEEAEAEAALPGLKAAVAAKASEESAAAEAAKAADAALKAAQAEQKSGDADVVALETKKAKLEKVIAETYSPMKEGQPVKKGGVKPLLAVGKEFSFDASLLESAPAALSKMPEARGDFDKIILERLDGEFKKSTDALDAEIQALEPAKAQRAEAVSAAQGACDTAHATKEAAKASLKEAKQNLKAGEKALEAATEKVKNWLPDIKVLFDELEAAKTELSVFKEGPMKTFLELKDMETPPPPPEEPEEAEEEAPAEAVEEAPATEAAAEPAADPPAA